MCKKKSKTTIHNLNQCTAVPYILGELQDNTASVGFKKQETWVLYMSFDRFLLAVELRDLSQADKSIIRVSAFPKAVFE